MYNQLLLINILLSLYYSAAAAAAGEVRFGSSGMWRLRMWCFDVVLRLHIR